MTVTTAPGRYPLTAAQAGIWAGQRLAPGDPMYHTGEYVDLRGPLDATAFEAALRDTVAEAPVLHARYPDDAPVFSPRPADDWSLTRVDLRAAADPYAAARAWMRADLARSLDLAAGPPFRQALLRVTDDRHLWWQLIHHIAADGYAYTLLARRVAGLYSARVAGEPADRSGFGSLDAVLAEDAAYPDTAAYAADRAFWLDRYADRPVPATLTGRLAPARGGALRHGVALPDPAGLRAAAAAAGLTWTDLAIGSFAAHVASHRGADEVVLGLPVAGRLRSAALRVPCMWMNIVPLRIRVDPGAGLLDVAGAVAAELRAVRPHSRYRYEQLRRDLGLLGGDRRLFGPVVNVLPFDHRLRFAGLTATVHNVGAGPVEDLSLVLHDRPGVPTAELDANPDSYTVDELRGHADAWLDVLAAGVAEPDRPVRRVRWLDGGPLPVTPRPVPALIAEAAAGDPRRTAVIAGDREIDYGTLHEWATGLAARLRAAGAGTDRPVAVALPRGLDAVVAILGVLYAGAAYLPLDPDGPAARTAAVLADADPHVVVTARRYAHLAAGRTRVRPDERGDTGGLPAPDLRRDAYVIYTSGSTGTPNGVVVDHAALGHFVAGATARYGVTAADRVLQFAPLHFDASVEELFLTLCAGATLVLRDEDMVDVGRLLAGCARHSVTVLDLPTAYWHEVAYALRAGTVRLPAALHTVIIGGEAAAPARVADWRTAAPGVRLLNTYGPTEATVVATVADLSAGSGDADGDRSEDDSSGGGGGDSSSDSDSGGEVPIGLPLPGVRAALVAGELYLAGGGLARGYLNRPTRTAERFATVDGVRAYRTGDRARRRADGQLVFAGRVDDEVKISGHRVDPAEVEAALLTHPGVRAAAVVAVPAGSGGSHLVAHVVPAGGPVDPAELRAHCATTLPAPVLPAAFMVAEALPRTGTGKVDRVALRDRGLPAVTGAGFATASRDDGPAPGDGLQAVVAGVWQEVLGTRPGIHDDFFALGGQSLQTVQVSTRLGAALGVDVPVALVFRHPTVAGLAAALDPAALGPADDAHLRDAVLPADIVPGPARLLTRPHTVLLTGATGYVGRYLLAELLATTPATVVCPVRAATDAEAAERLGPVLPAGVPRHRVRAVAADLARPRLGLDAVTFAALAEEVDAVYHCAAQVSVARGYASVRAVNVLGTVEVLRLAAAGRASAVHHVSTVAVLPPGGAGGYVDAHPGLRDGYQRSKWAAERLVAEAGRRGLPVATYRLGRVTPPVAGGPVNADDLVWRLLAAAVAVGAVPELDLREPWTPADEVAAAIVRMSAGPPGVADLLPARPVRLDALVDRLVARGHHLARIPAAEWAAAVEGGEHAALADIVRGAADRAARTDRYAPGGPAPDRAATGKSAPDRSAPDRSATAAPDGRQPGGDTGAAFSPIDDAVLDRYLDAAVAARLLPPPGTPPPPGTDNHSPKGTR